MERSSHWTSKKIIAFILLILSALLIIFPWMNIYVNILGQRLTIPRVLDYADPSGYSEFKAGIYEGLSELSRDMASEDGIYMSADQAMSVVELILNGRISPIDAARICSAAASILAKMKACMVKEYQDYCGTEKVIADFIRDGADKVAVAAVIMWVLIIGGAIALAFALYLLIKDKKYSAIPYFCFSALLLIVFVVATSKANDGIRRYVGIAYLLPGIGIGNGLSEDFSFFHLGISAILSFVFATGALVLSLLQKTGERRAETVESAGWYCSTCGRYNEGAFCTNCGRDRYGRAEGAESTGYRRDIPGYSDVETRYVVPDDVNFKNNETSGGGSGLKHTRDRTGEKTKTPPRDSLFHTPDSL